MMAIIYPYSQTKISNIYFTLKISRKHSLNIKQKKYKNEKIKSQIKQQTKIYRKKKKLKHKIPEDKHKSDIQQEINNFSF